MTGYEKEETSHDLITQGYVILNAIIGLYLGCFEGSFCPFLRL